MGHNVRLGAACHVYMARDDDRSAVALSLHAGKYVLLNAVAGDVLELLLETGCALDEAVPKVAAAYKVTPERLAGDLMPVVELLRKRQILTAHKQKG